MIISCFVILLLLSSSINSQTLKIGALMTVAEEERAENENYSGAFETHGYFSINGWRMWESMVNAAGGVSVGGTNYTVEITVINVGDTTEKIRRVTNETCLGEHGDFDLLFAPWSSGYTEISALVTEEHQKLMLAGFAASTSVFKCLDGKWMDQEGCFDSGTRRFEYTWGIIKPAEYWVEDTLNILKLRGAETMFTWMSDTAFTLSITEGGEDQAERIGIEVLERMTVGVFPTDEEIESVIDKIVKLDPDIVLGSPRYWEGCVKYINALKSRGVSAKAMILGQCTTYPQVWEAVGEDLRYFIDSVTWSPLVRGSEYSDSRYFQPTDEKQSAELFSDAYQELYNEVPEAICAVAFAQGEVVEFILKKATSVNQDEMVENLRLLLETSFFGTLGFDAFGMNDKMAIPNGHRDVNNTFGLISPLGSSTLDLVYPFPQWDERVQTVGYLGFVEEKVVFVITIVASVVSVVLGILILNQKDSNNSVSAASPNFLLLILLGSLLMYGSVLSWMMWMNTFMCISKTWFLGVGFVLIFGTLVAKTHRIRKIFIFSSFEVKAITDKQLFGLVLILVAIEIVINLVWTLTSPSIADIEIIDANRPKYNYFRCSWKPVDNVFLAISIVYKVLIVLYSLYLSTKLWRHSKSVYVESKQIIFSIYNLTIFGGVFTAIQWSLQTSESQSILFILRSACIILSVLIVVLSMTIPRFTHPDKGLNYDISKKSTKSSGGTTVVDNDLRKKYNKLKKLTALIIEENELSIELSD